MKKMSIQDLKAGLSGAIAEAEAGNVVVITRHNHPVAQLIPAYSQNVHRGANVGKGTIVPALRRGSKGRYLDLLIDDRGDR
jgi:prevent-host-death family protein